MELEPLISGVEKMGAMAVLVPCSQAEAVWLPSWQQSCSMVLCGCLCSTKPPWRGRRHHQLFPDGQTGIETPCPEAPSPKVCEN